MKTIRRKSNECKPNLNCMAGVSLFLPTELIPNPELINEISKFFEFHRHKNRYSQDPPIYGYSSVDHKEGIKLLTGSYFNQFANKRLVPTELVHPLNYLSQVLDAVTKRLIEVLDYNSVFQEKPSLLTLIEHADLPWQEEYFGMLDIVSYFNTKSVVHPISNGQTVEDVNCVPHYDPGLLSISILSTHEGLQLKNMTTNEWIDGPRASNIGVIWLGEAASRITQNRLKSGIHRVIYPQQPKCRLTVWYEVCTIEQLKSISAEQEDEPMDVGDVTFENLPGSAPITVLPGEKKLEFLRRVEMAYGLSSSKVGPPFYQLDKHAISYPTTGLKTE